MRVSCKACGHEGEAKTNSRHETRCENCYSLDVVPVESSQKAEVSSQIPMPEIEPEPEEKVKTRKRMRPVR